MIKKKRKREKKIWSYFLIKCKEHCEFNIDLKEISIQILQK